MLVLLLLLQSLSDRGSSSRQVSRPSSLGSSVSDVRDEQQQPPPPTTPISAHPVAAAAAALAAGALTPNGDIDYKKVSTLIPCVSPIYRSSSFVARELNDSLPSGSSNPPGRPAGFDRGGCSKIDVPSGLLPGRSFQLKKERREARASHSMPLFILDSR